jgi:PAS domain S-box-containing protein
MTTDPLGIITDINQQMEELTGYSREELIGTPFKNYFTNPQRAEEGIKLVLREGKVTNYELTAFSKEGHMTVVSYNASTFRDATGQLQGVFAAARVITEQKKLEAQLRESQAYNRGLIEASVDGLITVDPSGTISDVNEQMCRMSGYPREELIGTPFADYFMDAERATDGVNETFERGIVTDYVLTLATRDGRHLLVSFNASVFKDPTGAVRGIFASARDITEQSRLQAQLAEERAYNRALIEASVDGLVTVDESMTITDVNDTLCRMVGRQRSQLIGSSFPSYFIERDRAEEGVRLTYNQGAVTNYVLTLQAADGHLVPVSFNAAIFKDTGGRVRGIFASARDITAQQQLEVQLQASQTYTRSLIESNIDALMTTDPLGIITDVNQQMEVLTGSTRDELIGTPFKNYFTDPKRAEEGIKLVIREGKVTNYELTARSKSGHDNVVSYNAATFYDRDNKLQGVFAAARDITAQKKLEEQLREQQIYLRGLIESSLDGLVTVDLSGTITDVNDRMCQMTGYNRAELLGTPFADYFTEPQRAKDGVLQTFDAGVVTEYALTLISRSRRFLQVSFNASVFKDPTGAVRGIFASARDITDRARLEEQLREQQTYLRGLIESSVDGLVTVDPDGFITDVNEQLCRMTDFERDELIGSPFKQYFTETERADLGVKRTMAEGVVTNYELVLRTKSGRKAVVSFNASIFRAGDGKIQGIFASARDISEQARLQTQLADQQAYNRSLIEASADALFAIAPDGIITDVNEEATRLAGFSRKHLINSRFAEYFTDPVMARAGVHETLREGRVIGYELVLITRHGRRITVSFNAGVFTDATGQPLGILAAARDITEQKQLEQQLRDQQLYTRSLIESNIDALMTTDPLGIITDVNQQMEALTGSTRDELIGTPFKNYFTDPRRAEEGIREVLRESKVTNYELTAHSKAGNETVVSYNAATFYDRDGKLQGVFAAARDVTERKRFEQTMEEKNLELENANLAKDRFLASMSHELRTPLNAIIGFTGTLLMGLPGPLTGDQDKQLRTIQASAKHLLSLINDLLDLAKIESGKVELNFESVDCQNLVQEVANALRPLAESKGLAFETKVPAQACVVQTDRRALSQIIINLTNNAIKFTEHGQVGLELGQRQDNGRVLTEISVVDTGIGIRMEDQTKLFEAFSQVDSSAARRHEGTGLGLYLSQKLAALLRGYITFASEYGHGSTFTVTIPET